MPIEQKDIESLSGTLPDVFVSPQGQSGSADVSPANDDVDATETSVMKVSSADKTSHFQDDLQPTSDSTLIDHGSKDIVSDVVPLVLTQGSGHLEGGAPSVSKTQSKALCTTLSTEKVMERLLNDETNDLPAHALAVSPICMDTYMHMYVCMHVRT